MGPSLGGGAGLDAVKPPQPGGREPASGDLDTLALQEDDMVGGDHLADHPVRGSSPVSSGSLTGASVPYLLHVEVLHLPADLVCGLPLSIYITGGPADSH